VGFAQQQLQHAELPAACRLPVVFSALCYNLGMLHGAKTNSSMLNLSGSNTASHHCYAYTENILQFSSCISSLLTSVPD
jgi:hypothetical protein